MYARLIAKTGKMAGTTYEIVTDAVIGHGPECNLLVKSGVLSAKHARIFFDQKKNSFFLEDFKTHNGTLLDGKPVQGKVKLEKKHVIMFANTFTFMFHLEQGQANDPLPPPPTDIPPEPEIPARRRPAEPLEAGPRDSLPVAPPKKAPAEENPFNFDDKPARHHTVFEDNFDAMPPLIPDEVSAPPKQQARDAAPTMLIDDAQLAALLQTPPRFMLEFKNVRGEKYTIDLKEGENSVGRISGSDVSVDDASISRNHALITVRAGKVSLRDLGSKNGTFIGDKKLAAETEVKPDSPIRFGLVKATVVRKPEKPA